MVKLFAKKGKPEAVAEKASKGAVPEGMERVPQMVREPAVSGKFYPADAGQLRGMVEKFIKDANPEKPRGKLRAIVVPHAGYMYSGAVAGFGYKLLKDLHFKDKAPEVVLLGPAHTLAFEGAALPESDAWKTPLGNVFVSLRAKQLVGEVVRVMESAHVEEHSLEVQLPFLQSVFGDFSIVPIIAGEVSPQQLAAAIDRFIGPEDVLIVSSDLSHYRDYDRAVETDAIANVAVPGIDFEQVNRSVEACGKVPLLVLMYIAKKRGWRGHLIVYRNSGDATGEKTEVVGYACYAFYE